MSTNFVGINWGFQFLELVNEKGRNNGTRSNGHAVERATIRLSCTKPCTPVCLFTGGTCPLLDRQYRCSRWRQSAGIFEFSRRRQLRPRKHFPRNRQTPYVASETRLPGGHRHQSD